MVLFREDGGFNTDEGLFKADSGVFLGDMVRSNSDESWFLWLSDVVILGGVVGMADFIGLCRATSDNRPSSMDLGQISSLFKSILHSTLGMAIILLRMANGIFCVVQ